MQSIFADIPFAPTQEDKAILSSLGLKTSASQADTDGHPHRFYLGSWENVSRDTGDIWARVNVWAICLPHPSWEFEVIPVDIKDVKHLSITPSGSLQDVWPIIEMIANGTIGIEVGKPKPWPIGTVSGDGWDMDILQGPKPQRRDVTFYQHDVAMGTATNGKLYFLVAAGEIRFWSEGPGQGERFDNADDICAHYTDDTLPPAPHWDNNNWWEIMEVIGGESLMEAGEGDILEGTYDQVLAAFEKHLRQPE